MIFIKSQPVGPDYQALLTLLEPYCERFSLVLKRSGIGRSKRAQELEESLREFLVSDEEVSRWPGTMLGGAGVARLGVYRLEAASMGILRSLPGLYHWRLPEHPEDLCLYSAEGKCFLSSTAHELESAIPSAAISREQFAAKVPGVRFDWFPGSR